MSTSLLQLLLHQIPLNTYQWIHNHKVERTSQGFLVNDQGYFSLTTTVDRLQHPLFDAEGNPRTNPQTHYLFQQLEKHLKDITRNACPLELRALEQHYNHLLAMIFADLRIKHKQNI